MSKEELIKTLEKTKAEHLSEASEIKDVIADPIYFWLMRHYYAYEFVLQFIKGKTELQKELEELAGKINSELIKIYRFTQLDNRPIALINSYEDKIYALEVSIELLTS
jgi:hypothetical protein